MFFRTWTRLSALSFRAQPPPWTSVVRRGSVTCPPFAGELWQTRARASRAAEEGRDAAHVRIVDAERAQRLVEP